MLETSSGQNPGIRVRDNENGISSAREYEELTRSMECVSLQCSTEETRNESLSSLEEQKSFYQLNTTPVPVDKTSPQHLFNESVTFRQEALSSEEKLPVKVFDRKYVKLPEKFLHVHEANKAVAVDSQCNSHVKEPDQGFPEVQKSSWITRETSLEVPGIRLQAVQQNVSFLGRREKHSSSVPGSSCRIPVWVCETDFSFNLCRYFVCLPFFFFNQAILCLQHQKTWQMFTLWLQFDLPVSCTSALLFALSSKH